MGATVARIRRYPVKGLSGETLEEIALHEGRVLPGDRRFAIARGGTEVDTTNPTWRPKSDFVTLMRIERLAQLETAYDPNSGSLTIRRRGRPVARATITEPVGRMVIDQFLAAFLEDSVQRAPKLVDAGEISLTDNPDGVISVLNLASVRDLERVTDRPINPERFRANVHLEGVDAWDEMSWIGRDLRLGDVRVNIVEPIDRCAAVDVDPETARRDLNLPKTLMRAYGHIQMGVYAKVTRGGMLRAGDGVAVAADGE